MADIAVQDADGMIYNVIEFDQTVIMETDNAEDQQYVSYEDQGFGETMDIENEGQQEFNDAQGSEIVMGTDIDENVLTQNDEQNFQTMEDFMDIITTYKCKMCDYSATVLEEFSKHVKSSHVHCDKMPAAATGAVGTPSAMPLQPDTGGLSQLTSQVSPTNPQGGMIQIGDKFIHYEIDPTSENTLSLQSLSQEAYETEKELYVCGACNLGFQTMESCKEHMIQDHNITVDSLDDSSADGQQTGKTSVGVQAQRKRPGRRRKEERRPPSPAESTIVLSDEDGEELTSKPQVFETSNRRKVRPPKALTDCYYIGKQKNRSSAPCRVAPSHSCPRHQCSSSFSSKEALELHESCHIPPEKKEKKPWQCPQCHTQFNQWKQVRMHLWNEHRLDTDLLRCPDCDFRTDAQRRLDDHIEFHVTPGNLQCDICSKTFKHMHQLRSHLVLHSDKARKVFTAKTDAKEKDRVNGSQCHICNRVLTNERCLARHIEAVHEKSVLFQCPHCSHTASRKAMMILHIRGHTGEKPFWCDQCNYKTGDHNSLRRHKMRHTGSRKYQCPHCSYAAIQAISLKVHIKSKHPGGEGVHACDLCNFRTINQLMYKNHLLDHQNGLVIAKEVVAEETQPGPVIQFIKDGVLGTLVSSDISPSKNVLIYANDSQQGISEGSSQTITLHLADQNTAIGNGQVVIMEPTDGSSGQETVAYASDGSIMQLSQLSSEMMEAIAAQCSNGQQVTINMGGENGELIITTAGAEEITASLPTTHQIIGGHIHNVGRVQQEGQSSDNEQKKHTEQLHSVSAGTAQLHSVATGTAQLHSVATGTEQLHSVATGTEQLHSVATGTEQLHSVATGTEQLHSVATGTEQLHSVATGTEQLHSVATGTEQLHSVATGTEQLHSVATGTEQLHSVATGTADSEGQLHSITIELQSSIS